MVSRLVKSLMIHKPVRCCYLIDLLLALDIVLERKCRSISRNCIRAGPADHSDGEELIYPKINYTLF